MADHDLSRVSRETLERLARAVPKWWSDEEPEHQPAHAPETTEVINAIRAVRSESRVPQRTLAEVDAEIAREIRASVALGYRGDCLTGTSQSQGEVSDRIRALCAEPTAEPASERGNPLVRITWQCGSCGWGYFGPLQEACPGCGAEGFWSGSVAPDCKPWPGYHCAAAPGVKVAPLPTPARVQLLEEIADDLVDMLDGEPSGSDSLDWALERYGYKPTKGVPAEPECTEEASPEPTTGKICVRCGEQVEAERECYVIPHCLKCLPAPEPLPVRELQREACDASVSDLVRALQDGNKFLQDQLVAANAARRLRLAEIYHLTITYGDDPERALLAIRHASGPGA